jgi:hypothetical protein
MKARVLPGFLALTFYLAAAACTIGANPFRGETITPFDILASQRAWTTTAPKAKVRHFQRSDVLNSRLPQWEVAKKRIRSGEIPLWNDKIAGGGSFLTVNSNLFTPAFAIFAAIPDSPVGFYVAMLANLALAGLGMHLFLRRHVGLAAAVAGALGFEFCGFTAAWLYWPHVFTVMWAPWLLWAVDRTVRAPRMSNALLVAAATALACCGGFPFLGVLVLEAGALYALASWIPLLRAGAAGRVAAWYAAGSAVGLLIATLPLLGLHYWLEQFDIGYRYGRGSYLSLAHAKQLLPPWAYATQRVEQTMYVGVVMTTIAAATLLVIAIRRRRLAPLHVFAIALLAISAGLVFELWPMWLIGWMPGMAFNSWSRAIALLDISIIVLGAIGIDAAWRWSARPGRGPCFGALVVLLAVQVVELPLFFRDYNGPVDAADYYPDVPTISYVEGAAGPFDHAITDRAFLMSGTLGAYGIREWMAHYFRSPALQDALHRMARHPFNSHRASASRFPARNIRFGSAAMSDFNVRFALVDSRFRSRKSTHPFRRVFTAMGTTVLENADSPRGPYFLSAVRDHATKASGQHVRIASYAPERFVLEYDDAAPGYVVVPMTFIDDWHATVDGKPVRPLLKDGVMPAIPVSGPSTIRMRYSPHAVAWLWPWLGLLGASMLAMWLFDRRSGKPRVPTRVRLLPGQGAALKSTLRPPRTDP